MLISAIPEGTKIYLQDKTLVPVEDLKFGSELLSLKVDDFSIDSGNDFYNKYVKNSKITNKILSDKLSIDSATVCEIKKISKNLLINNSVSINPILSIFYNNDIYCITKNEFLNMKSESNEKIIELENPNDILFSSFKIFGMTIDYIDNMFIENSYISSFKKDNIYIPFNKDCNYYSISLSKNYFYFSEHACFVGLSNSSIYGGAE